MCIECHQPGSLPAVVAAARAELKAPRQAGFVALLFDERHLPKIVFVQVVFTAVMAFSAMRTREKGAVLIALLLALQTVWRLAGMWIDAIFHPPLRILTVGLEPAARACSSSSGSSGALSTGAVLYSARSQAAQAVWEGRCKVGAGWSQRARLKWLLEQWRVVQQHEGLSVAL
ncbi:hypothetical protein GPECTOR_7g1260 [Gonium pectorale]|uniref:Uncharacterized protein n=1 Tax=Gonium pectorale TaxID=33097 RepID=A0A150GU99_GONPE|nr:hypothetical protein GPECTOR_7g1260 [Gonium pectorale]|eukprot:KXZ53364.1 hypothetical protein GPECTOR_7g1260 [Gonium pectorale]